MAFQKWKQAALSVFTLILILGISFAVISYGRGYRLDINDKSVGSTGLITATSDPVGATIFINGKKQSATNTNMNVAPGWYTITIAKEGYQTWEKRIRVQGEIVARADAMLFPANPSLYAMTTNGALAPTLSPDGTKLAYIVPKVIEATNGGQLVTRDGVWVLDISDRPLGLNRDARQILKGETLSTDTSLLTWSPDSKELLLTQNPQNTPSYYLLDTNELNTIPTLVMSIEVVKKQWQELQTTKTKEKLLPLKEDFLSIATGSMSNIAFSPDETKILYEATRAATIPQIITPALVGTNPMEEVRAIKPGGLYVYDIKEDRNYKIGETPVFLSQLSSINPASKSIPKNTPPIENSGQSLPVQWLPTSRHLIITSKDKIEVMEFDGANRKTVYAGPFWDSFVAPWTNASKLIILTNLNAAVSTMPNLYAVNIR